MFKANIRLTKNSFLILSILYLGISLWQYLFLTNLVSHFKQLEMIYSIFYVSLAFSMFLNKLLEDKNQLRIIFIWSIVSAIATIFLIFTTNLISVYFIVCVLGGLYSISLFAFFSYFCDLTTMGERGRVGGVIVFIPLVLLPVITMFLSLLGFQGGMILCSILSLSVLTVLMLNPKLLPKKEDSELETYARKTVFHYLVPWVVFSVINGMLAPIITQSIYQRFPESFLLLILLQNIVAPFGALIGGILADLIGRRLTLMLGLTLYGISTAFSALSNITGIVLFSSSLSGIAWGIFLVLYFLVVWGDLSNRRSRFSYYMSGFPFFISTGLSYFLTNIVFGISVENIILFSVFLILLSNLPLIFANELLPAGILQETSLRRFISRVKEIQEKN